MLPKYHILIGFIISIFLFLIFPITILQTSIIFLSSFFIDFDHYLFYIYKKEDFNPKNSFDWFMKKGKEYSKLSKKQRDQIKQPIFLFHGLEFWILLLILAIFNKIFIFILIGIFIHMILDYIDLYHRKEPFYKKTSQILVYIRNKNKKELGF